MLDRLRTLAQGGVILGLALLAIGWASVGLAETGDGIDLEALAAGTPWALGLMWLALLIADEPKRPRPAV